MSTSRSATPNPKLNVAAIEEREARWVKALQDWDDTEPSNDSNDIWDLARMAIAFADNEADA